MLDYAAFGLLADDQSATGAGPYTDLAGLGGHWGYYTDPETGNGTTAPGLLCLTHRYYDPGTGRFVTRDPAGYGGGVNLYGFAGDNPINGRDPGGLWPDGLGDPGGLIPLSIPTEDMKAGLGAAGYLAANAIRSAFRRARELFDENAEAQGTAPPEAPQGVDPVASPEEQAEEEEDQTVTATERPLVLPSVRPYNARRIPGYDQHHLEPPYGPHPPDYDTDDTIDVLNENMPRRIPGGRNIHTGPGGLHSSLDQYFRELGVPTRAAQRALPRDQYRLMLRRYYSSLGIPYRKH